MSNRKRELSLMNIILCLLVIFIHTASHFVTVADKASFAFAIISTAWRLSALAVYGFIFLSAIKFSLGANRESFSYFRYIKSRIVRVWLPYICAAVLYYSYFILQGYMSFDARELFKMLLDGNMSSHFYFVICIMQFYLLAPLWRWLCKKLTSPEYAAISLVVSLLVGLLLGQYLPDTIRLIFPDYYYPYADRTFTFYIFWWMLGLVVGQHYERIASFARKKILPLGILFVCAAIPNALLGYIHLTGKTTVYWLETVHIFYVFCSVIFLFALCVRLSDAKAASLSPLTHIDLASYSIYLWHPLAIYFANHLLSHLNVPLWAVFSTQAAFAFIGTIGLCTTVQALTNRIRRSRICKQNTNADLK